MRLRLCTAFQSTRCCQLLLGHRGVKIDCVNIEGLSLRRGMAFLALFALLFSTSGAPMCISVLSHLAAPCPMHDQQQSNHHQTAVHSILASLSGDGCHADSSAPDCAGGGACPSGGAAVRAAEPQLTVVVPPSSSVPFGVISPFQSHLAPPLSPPPLA